MMRRVAKAIAACLLLLNTIYLVAARGHVRGLAPRGPSDNGGRVLKSKSTMSTMSRSSTSGSGSKSASTRSMSTSMSMLSKMSKSYSSYSYSSKSYYYSSKSSYYSGSSSSRSGSSSSSKSHSHSSRSDSSSYSKSKSSSKSRTRSSKSHSGSSSRSHSSDSRSDSDSDSVDTTTAPRPTAPVGPTLQPVTDPGTVPTVPGGDIAPAPTPGGIGPAPTVGGIGPNPPTGGIGPAPTTGPGVVPTGTGIGGGIPPIGGIPPAPTPPPGPPQGTICTNVTITYRTSTAGRRQAVTQPTQQELQSLEQVTIDFFERTMAAGFPGTFIRQVPTTFEDQAATNGWTTIFVADQVFAPIPTTDEVVQVIETADYESFIINEVSQTGPYFQQTQGLDLVAGASVKNATDTAVRGNPAFTIQGTPRSNTPPPPPTPPRPSPLAASPTGGTRRATGGPTRRPTPHPTDFPTIDQDGGGEW